MSTRASIILKDESTTLFFYRHSDGYPECTGADLKEFVKGYQSGAMRADSMQSAGWLIVRGAFEYSEGSLVRTADEKKPDGYQWKVGAYEPTDSLAGDVEYVYLINLEKMTLECREPTSAFWESPNLGNTVPCKEFKTVRFGMRVAV